MCYISFIVPVYNLKESEVRNCIHSIKQQTYEDYEVIIVDDGSTNGIEKVCDEIGEREGIKVIHQKNQGLAAARNTGMNASSGVWIVHVDGDDWVDSHLAEELKNKSIDSTADIIIWGFVLDSGSVQQELLLKDKCAFDRPYSKIKENVLCSILDYDNSFASLSINTSWGKAYRRDFIERKKLFYDLRLRRAQDVVYNLYAFTVASKIEYIDKALNIYRNDNVSLSRGYNPKTFEYLRATALAVNEYDNENDVSENVKIASVAFIQRCFRMINEQSFLHKNNKDSFATRKRQFTEAIKSEPFLSAFASGVVRNAMLDKITDILYKHKFFFGISCYNACLGVAFQFKRMLRTK